MIRYLLQAIASLLVFATSVAAPNSEVVVTSSQALVETILSQRAKSLAEYEKSKISETPQARSVRKSSEQKNQLMIDSYLAKDPSARLKQLQNISQLNVGDPKSKCQQLLGKPTSESTLQHSASYKLLTGGRAVSFADGTPLTPIAELNFIFTASDQLIEISHVSQDKSVVVYRDPSKGLKIAAITAKVQTPQEKDDERELGTRMMEWRLVPVRAGDTIRGYKIAAMVPSGYVEKAGFKTEDLILKVDGQVASTSDVFTKVIKVNKNGILKRVEIERDGKPMTLTFE